MRTKGITGVNDGSETIDQETATKKAIEAHDAKRTKAASIIVLAVGDKVLKCTYINKMHSITWSEMHENRDMHLVVFVLKK